MKTLQKSHWMNQGFYKNLPVDSWVVSHQVVDDYGHNFRKLGTPTAMGFNTPQTFVELHSPEKMVHVPYKTGYRVIRWAFYPRIYLYIYIYTYGLVQPHRYQHKFTSFPRTRNASIDKRWPMQMWTLADGAPNPFLFSSHVWWPVAKLVFAENWDLTWFKQQT